MRKQTMIAGALAFTLAGAGAVAAGEALTSSGPASAHELVVTPQSISAAANILAHECLTATADGTTIQTGTRSTSFSIFRRFAANVSCQVIEKGDHLTGVTVTDNTDELNNFPTTISMAYRDSKQTEKGGPTSWEFTESATPDEGPTVQISGYAATDGTTSQSWAIGCPNGLTGLEAACDSSIILSGPPGPNLTPGIFEQVYAAAQESMSVVVHHDQQG